MSRKAKPRRPEEIEIQTPDGVCFVVKPYTRRQMRAAIALDPERGEVRGMVQASELRAQQLEILVGETVNVKQADGSFQNQPSGPVLGALTPDEEMQILAAILAEGLGQDGAAAVAANRFSKKKDWVAAMLAFADLTTTASHSPASSGER